MKRLFIVFLILFMISNAVQAGEIFGGSTTSAPSSGGGGSRTPDIDNFIRQVEGWKNNYPDKFENLKKLLYIQPFVIKDYDTNISFGLAVTGNKTKTRNDKFIVGVKVVNPNPIEIRRVLYIYLDVLEPGEKSFQRVNSIPIMIMNNEYTQNKEGKNESTRTFPELASFSELRATGPVILRLYVSDGQYEWIPTSYTLNIVNSPPVLENQTLQAPDRPRFNDPIVYSANITDLDGDMVNITLHVLDAKGMEKRNVTQQIKGNGTIRFKSNEYGLFSEEDAGRNFTYFYTFDDGINESRIEVQEGPSIRVGPKLFVDKLGFIPESENYFWWQWYTFNVRAKNQNPEKFDVSFTLYTKTGNNEWETVDSKTVNIGPEQQVVCFNLTKPFLASDANESFHYMMRLSEYDQNGKDTIEASGPRLNAKIVPYAIYNPIMLFNLIMIFVFILVGSLFIERSFKHGTMFKRGPSARSNKKNNQSDSKSNEREGRD